jgi:hypothetical protein
VLSSVQYACVDVDAYHSWVNAKYLLGKYAIGHLVP